MTKPLRERWQLHRGPRNRLVILGRAGQECWSFEQFLGQDKKNPTVHFLVDHGKEDRRQQDLVGEEEPSPWDLGTVPLSAADPCIALDVSLAATVRAWATQRTSAGEPSDRINSGLFVTQISAGTSAWPREEGEGSFCQLHHRKKHS